MPCPEPRVRNGGTLVPLWVSALCLIVPIVLACAPAQKADPAATQNTPATVAKEDSPPSIPAKEIPANVAAPPKLATGAELYARHCAACHGERGDGQGPAAAYLFPKPRNFQTAKFRLVSTPNYVPSDADFEAVLTRGMPGSAMPPWPKLSADERTLIIAEVRRLVREGLREQFIAFSKQQGDDEPEEADIAAFVKNRSVPQPAGEVPALPPSSAEAVARGKELYVKQSCHSCHGLEGKGDGVQAMVDEDKLPTRPRDLTRGIFKGGHDVASIYRRLTAGMPGTPMPSSPNLKPEQLADLIHFLRSLSGESARAAAVLTRERITARLVSAIPETANTAEWEAASPTAIRTTPLWWRDDVDLQLSVAAMHDGKLLALRLRWQDPQANYTPGRTEAFRDAAAVQFYKGAAEPFLGMGSKAAPIDLWMWDADRAHPAPLEEVNPRVVVDVYPFNETQVATAEYDRAGTKTENQPEVSLPAKATENQINRATQRKSGSSALTAAGPGSVTFRPRIDELVRATGEWREGQWTVVLTRPLGVANAQAGLSLAPGDQVSVAFAIWDGAHRDRDGQKMISIWQDLVLEAKP